MSIKCNNIVQAIEEMAPLYLAEKWDNVGLLLGALEQEISKVLVCVDVTSQVADEAVSKGVDLIVSHHPLIFEGLKRINEDDFKGRIIYKLIQNNIGVYSAHTNLDTADGGINDQLAGLIGLKEIKNLKAYRSDKLFKLVVFVPEQNADCVRDAMCTAGAGFIGRYSDCSFSTKGIGTFRPLEGTNPYIGTKRTLEKVDECRIETIVPERLLKKVIVSMLKAHPYEEVAYDIYPTELKGKEYGLGKVGRLEVPTKLNDFIPILKNKLGIDSLRITGSLEKHIERAAVFCGSFDEDLSAVLKEKVDVLITGDLKYHTAVEMKEMGMCVIDAGHFNTERIFATGMIEFIKSKFPTIDVIASMVENDPFIFS